MRARWVKACGKLPSASPVRPISSEFRPRWLVGSRIAAGELGHHYAIAAGVG
jgi:hypothetical protein